MAAVSTGMLPGGSPYLALGDGPPLVVAQQLTASHEVPSGMERRTVLSNATPLSSDFRVYVVNRKQGLRPGESMSDIAGHLAAGIEAEFGGPVCLTGASTGGSVALQLAIDRPDLVTALVLVASAFRLGPRGKQATADLARWTRDGDFARGLAQIGTAELPAPLRGPALPLFRLLARSMAPEDPSDMLVTLEAEYAFDAGQRLGRVAAPTLVIGGAKDPFYSRELFEQTAAGVQNGRAHINPRWGHERTWTSSATAHLTLGFLLANRHA